MTPVILECPSCRGSGRDPDAPAAIADDDGTCLTCCRPDHPWYVARHGQVGVPLLILADPALVDFLPLRRASHLSAGRGVNPGPAYDDIMTLAIPGLATWPSASSLGL